MKSACRVPLAPMTTLGLGGNAARVDEPGSDDELREVVARCAQQGEPIAVLGHGSNVIVADEGFSGTVIRLAHRKITGIRDGEYVNVSVGAGCDWAELVATACDEGWAGVECLAGIPGTVGAAPMQNIGAYGQEVGASIASVRVLHKRSGEVAVYTQSDCGFSYRDSVFKRDSSSIITEVNFRFAREKTSKPLRYAELCGALNVREGASAPLRLVADTVTKLRRKKGMVIDAADPDSRSAGSFFVNPILRARALGEFLGGLRRDGIDPPTLFAASDDAKKIPAAWLIEQAGFRKGEERGAFRISTKHALALVHTGGGTSTELLGFAHEISDRVALRFGVTLAREPVLFGKEPA